MLSSSPHAFRYEAALCTLPEGQTLSEWRRGDDPRERSPRPRRAQRGRLAAPRTVARLLSGR